MKVKGAPETPLSPVMRQLLLHGPAPDQPMPSQQQHDHLRVLWQQHGQAIMASLPRSHRPWFILREDFVRIVRGEKRWNED